VLSAEVEQSDQISMRSKKSDQNKLIPMSRNQ